MPLSTNTPGGAGSAAVPPGPPNRWEALLPVLVPVGRPFRLEITAASGAAGEAIRLETERPVQGLPETVTLASGERTAVIDGLVLAEECDLAIRVRGPGGSVLVESNPCRVSDAYSYSIGWAALPPGGEARKSDFPGSAAALASLEMAGSAAVPAGLAGTYATTGARVFLEAAVRDEAFTLDLAGASPVERIELCDGPAVLDVMRPFGKRDLGARVRVIWEGAESGAAGAARWDGNLYLHGNRIRQAKPVNFPPDSTPLETRGDLGLAWKAETQGGLGGLDLWLADATAGRMEIETPAGRFEVLLEDVGLEDMRFDLGGNGKALRLYRLPERLTAKTLKWSRSLAASDGIPATASLTARVTFEDGHQAWSGPLRLL